MTKAPVLLALTAAASLTPALALRSARLGKRLEEERESARDLAGEVARLRLAVDSLESFRRSAARAGAEEPRVDHRFGELESRLSAEEARALRLESGIADSSREARASQGLVERFGRSLQSLAGRFEGVGAGLESLSVAIEEEARARRSTLDALAARIDRDPATMARAMIGPIVQLSGEETVGSGVVVFARPAGAGFESFALTAFHVVRNIQSEGGDPSALRILLYQSSSAREVAGALVAHDEERDVALLRFTTDGPAPEVARLAPRERLASIPIFTPVYAVGCPLGNDPIPTAGEVASNRSVVGGEVYWMINAPAYFGNSGGGVYLAETQELIGLYSKIYTHGRGRPTVIAHMGLVTPVDAILDFLDRSGHSFIAEGAVVPQAASAARSGSR